MQGCGGRGRTFAPPFLLTKFLPPLQYQTCLSFVVKYLSENAPEEIAESLKLKFSWGSMPHSPSSPPLFQQVPVLPRPPPPPATFLNAALI